MSFDYEAMYEGAKDELERLQRFRANHEAKIVDLDNRIEAAIKIANAAAAVLGEMPVASLDSESDWLKIADAVALHAAGISVVAKAVIDSEPDTNFTAKLIRDDLQKRGWNWENYTNPLSTLHTTLKRLADSGAINSEGGKYYSTKRKQARGLLGVRLAGLGSQIPPDPEGLMATLERASRAAQEKKK